MHGNKTCFKIMTTNDKNSTGYAIKRFVGRHTYNIYNVIYFFSWFRQAMVVNTMLTFNLN